MYENYLKDVKIARKAIDDLLLSPIGEIVFDLYAIPSHNHQAYYLIIYKREDGFECVYAKTEIYSAITQIPIKIYTFSDVDDAQKNSGMIGKIIVGLTRS